MLSALAGKFQPGMYSLSLLVVLSHHLDYAAAALVASGSAWGTVTTPVRGRLLDRFPYARVLWPLLLLHLGFLSLLIVGLYRGSPLWALLLVAFCASVVVPPIGTVTRVIWRARSTPAVLPTALALDAVLTDIGFMVGPVLAIGLGRAIGPVAGVVACAVLMILVVPLILRSARGIAFERSLARSHWAGPLRRARVRWVFLVAALFFFGVKIMEMVLASFGSGSKVTLTGGAVLSLIAVASVIGGLAVGGLPTAVSQRLTRPAVIIAMIAGAVLLMAGLLTLADWSVYLVCVPVGLCLGPSFVAVYGAAGDAAGPGEQAETQSWVGSALMAGGALGTAAGGWAVQNYGHAAALAMGGLVMACGALAGTQVARRQVTEP
ncbi:MFS transporter [Streptomyces somaliensis]|uniref:MFS transporter n=1 Tax=Streptomyces somaliensis TaxID=78355 RepID=UPI0020CECB3C|nr:MFS transporter [Streptomyces somaliensis]MCP9945313.1 MFS transporter [Streptomyces somaliensis]MCP9961483.1 MFS transporter [Streptomyces somaliensis]MCP9974290.1 MFS transporter [Streptomyces somaliensis]